MPEDNTTRPDQGATITRDQAQESIIVITGGRDFIPGRDWESGLRRMLHAHRAIAFFDGDARGADRWAASVARRLNVPVHTVPALWKHQGKKSGPVRNARMLRWALLLGEELRVPVKVFALPGGVGTANMVKRAEALGVYVFPVIKGASS